MFEVVVNIFENIDPTTGVAIAIAVIGWLIALLLQRRNIKQQHKVQIRYEIYKQFVQHRKEVQDSINKLSASSHSPMISMESSMVPFNLKLEKKFRDQWIPYSEQECLIEGENKWSSFVSELYDQFFDFNHESISFFYLFDDWAAALKSLLSTKNVFFTEVNKISNQIREQLVILRSYPTDHGHDWRKWDGEKIEKITQGISEQGMIIGYYFEDFMVLIHNELLAGYFRYKRPTRKTLDPDYRVLMKEGIMQNVDWKFVKKSKAWREELIGYAKERLEKFSAPQGTISSEYERHLRSIVEGTCPECRTPILVLNTEKRKDGFYYRYACGHDLSGFMYQESLELKELYKVKSKRMGFGLVQRVVQGWKPSGDPKLKRGVDVFMEVNREKNEYHQLVRDYTTKEVLHKEDEPLTEHRQKSE